MEVKLKRTERLRSTKNSGEGPCYQTRLGWGQRRAHGARKERQEAGGRHTGVYHSLHTYIRIYIYILCVHAYMFYCTYNVILN